ncbi:TldD/PmbA family protein [Methanoregula formicica]|uniref:Putative Zn-dependent protease-like protein n=1 Tax=Methanoregula formicica (strain DSM 22288 / NBRC 105244 / SMSP) TaxID=593750 RepID=L0HE57_METFS|nr:TldD/PmbA family protein [Methanoregula formicica]AGB01374.1 putative Zn-dependent protease-like protein [Methanoregula formicica SMSP]
MDGISYYDLRHVTGEITHIDIDNGIIESAGTSFFNKAILRVLVRSGWGVLQIDNFSPCIGRKFDEMLEQAARLAVITEEQVVLGDVTRRQLPVPPMNEDPREISLEEKSAILSEIEKSATLPLVVNRRANYTEKFEQVHFSDSSGNEFTYAMGRSGFNVLAVASRNGNVQMGYEREHSIHGFNLRHQQDAGRKAAQTAVSLLDAVAAKGGKMRTVLDPELAGVFAHEAIGHASEGDLIQEGSSVLKGRTGERIGNETLTIVDDPSLCEFGFDPVDAEGVAVARTEIIRRGVVNAFLHNRESLAAIGNGVAGHARAMPGEPPLVRMSNTFIENGDSTKEEIFAECKNGIFLAGSRGGQVDPGRGIFQFNAEYGYLVENGECTKMVRDVSLSGEILSTLYQIVLCGNDRKMSPGYCGKGGQSVPVSDGAPHVLLVDAVVGGSGMD